MHNYSCWLFLLLGISAVGQNCQSTLSGKTIDFHNNSPLIGATVIVVGPEKATLTDLNGNFTIKGLCDGTYRLQISHPECLTKTLSVKIDGETFVEIHLEHHIDQLEKVVVKGNAFENALKSADEKRLSSKEIARYSAGSLGDALKKISGVSSLNTGSTISKPVIQGLSGSRILIMNHGTRMQAQEWGAEHAPNVDINSAGSISVIKGAAALQYGGDAVGGIIKIEPERVPRIDSLYGKTLFSAARNGRGASLTSSLTKSYKNGWFAVLQGTLKRFGDFETPEYVLSNTGFSEKDASFRFGFDKYTHGLEAYYSYFHSELGILSASHLGGIEDLFRALESEKPLIIRDFTYKIDAPKQEVSHHLAKLKYFKRFKNWGKLTLQYDFQQNHRLEFDRRRDSEDNVRPAIDLTLKTHSFSADFELNKINGFEGKIGIVGRYQDNYSNPETGVKRLIPDYWQLDFGGYAIASYDFNEKISAEAGFRYDFSHIDAYKYYATSLWEKRNYDEIFPEFEVKEYGTQLLTHPKLDFHAFSATAGINYAFDEDWKLLFNYSLASRIPNPSELFSEGLHHSASRIEIGDLRFGKETANKFSFSLHKQSEVFSFSLSPYINLIDDFMLLEPIGARKTIRGSFYVWEYRQTNARLFGMDFDASVKLAEQLRSEHSFSIVKGKDVSQKKALIHIPPANTLNRLIYSTEKMGNLRIALESKYVFEQNEFPNNNFEIFLPVSQATETVDISTPPEAYHLLNFYAGIDLTKTKNYRLRLGLDITNLFNKKYRAYLNRQRYYADNLGRNFALRLNLNY
ncbi:MAG TPA: TonB-dependent receptor [Flavobacteriaceae bacterium]|nr:TonB-dependent receptor [Flavobacteriaceae bacterium]